MRTLRRKRRDSPYPNVLGILAVLAICNLGKSANMGGSGPGRGKGHTDT